MNNVREDLFSPFNLVRGELRRAMKQVLFIFLALLALAAQANDDTRLTRGEYIGMWKDVAVENMVLFKIPASITLAQGILESGDGNSELARKANNHFGIKCHSDWTGKKVYHDDDAKGECFRKYNDARESYADHSEFLKKKRYEPLFQLEITDYKGWAHTLKQCGYATNPKYASLLIKIIEDNNLTQFDQQGLAMLNGVTAKVEPKSKAPRTARDRKKARGKADPDDAFADVTLANRRNIQLSDNRIKFVTAKAGDTFASIANELDMLDWQIRKYNDLPKNYRFTEGEIVYLQPKRARAKAANHTIQEGETLWDVSQKHGVKLKKLYKLNGMVPGKEAPTGTVVKLR